MLLRSSSYQGPAHIITRLVGGRNRERGGEGGDLVEMGLWRESRRTMEMR